MDKTLIEKWGNQGNPLQEIFDAMWATEEQIKNYAVFLQDTYLAWTNGYKNDKGYVYLISCGDFYKIGKTRDLDSRMSALSTANPYEIKLIAKKLVDRSGDLESMLHDVFSDTRVKGEWFSLSPNMVEVAIETLKICQ